MPDRSQLIDDCRDASDAAGLVYVSPDDPGLTRRPAGKGFSYLDMRGQRVGDSATLERIRSLVIPPAWTNVWISADPKGHIQAVGEDERGRRQYRYHAEFRDLREGAKFKHMLAFAEALPDLRRQVALDLAAPGLGRAKVLATVVRLLETTMIRVGNAAYARDNKSYGLTTLLSRHVQVDRGELRFNFKGKSGRVWRLGLKDRRIARIIKSCQELPGQRLFEYLDEAGEQQAVTSADVNAYLREISGADITAKDFRTWAGTVLAATALAELGPAETKARAKKNVTAAIARICSTLGNTPTICRKCYVHPEIIGAYLDGELTLEIQENVSGRSGEGLETQRPEEAAVLSFLRARTLDTHRGELEAAA